MNKWGILLSALLVLTACTEKNAQYYKRHPKELSQALNRCDSEKKPQTNCQQLEEIAAQLHQLAFQLQQNPQGFGIDILKLQDTISKQQAELQVHPSNPKLQSDILQNQQQLADLLNVVKWLESPEG